MRTWNVFVYGTLLKGMGNHYLLSRHSDSRFLGAATTLNDFFMFGRGFPLCRKPHKGENHAEFAAPVKGEVYNVGEEALLDMDRLEGHPNFYERRVTLLTEFSNFITYMYHWNTLDGIVAGSWNEPITKNDTPPYHSWKEHTYG